MILHGPAVAQGVSVSQVPAGQGRHCPAISQLRRVWVDVPEQAKACASQAGAPEEHVRWRVRFLSTHLAQCRRAPHVTALLAPGGRVTADTVQVATRHSPVTFAELVNVYGVLPNIGEDGRRGPATHNAPE